MAMKSQWQIEREAERLIGRSVRLFPDHSPVEALVAEASSGSTIKGSSIRRFRPSYRFALMSVGGEAAMERYDQLLAGLEEKRGRPDPEYGATRKETSVAKPDAIRIFRYLKRMVLRGGSHSAMAAGLYVLVVSRLALRPGELLEAEIVGDELRIRNAKWRPGMPDYRWLSLKRFAPTFLEALRWLIILAREGVEDGSGDCEEVRFERWRNRIASCLARASKIAIRKRLSLYSFRHLGIATWKASGFSETEIAALAGHLDLKSAAKHYAPASAGWAKEAALAEPGAGPVNDVREVNAAIVDHDGSKMREEGQSSTKAYEDSNGGLTQAKEKSKEDVDASATPGEPFPDALVFVVEDMPRPSPRKPEPKDTPPDMEAWNRKQDRIADEIEEIARRLQPSPWQETPGGRPLSIDRDDED
jgi:hypothetical protein